MLKSIHARTVAASRPAAAQASLVVAKNAFNHLYDANQRDDITRRPGWPYDAGQVTKLTGGAELAGFDLEKLPKGSKAVKDLKVFVDEGVDGDQCAFHLKVGNTTYLVVAAFPEDAARDQIWVYDAKGQKLMAEAQPNEDTGKLHWS